MFTTKLIQSACLLLTLLGTCFASVSNTFLRDDDPLQDLQVMWNGVWEQGGLADPTQLINCFNETTGQMTMDFIGKILDEAANNQFFQARATFINFEKDLPQPLKDCVMQDPEITQVEVAYNVANKTYHQLADMIFGYVIDNIDAVHQVAVTLDDDFKAADYYDVGKIGGQTLQAMFSPSTDEAYIEF